MVDVYGRELKSLLTSERVFPQMVSPGDYWVSGHGDGRFVTVATECLSTTRWCSRWVVVTKDPDGFLFRWSWVSVYDGSCEGPEVQDVVPVRSVEDAFGMLPA